MEGNTEPITLGALAKGAVLLLLAGSGEPRRLAILNRPLRVGSADDNDIVFDDRAVSAHHCILNPRTKACWCETLIVATAHGSTACGS